MEHVQPEHSLKKLWDFYDSWFGLCLLLTLLVLAFGGDIVRISRQRVLGPTLIAADEVLLESFEGMLLLGLALLYGPEV